MKNKKYVTTNCSLYFEKDLKINCNLSKEKGIFKIKQGKDKAELQICRFKSKKELKFKDKTLEGKNVYINCLDGELKGTDFKTIKNELKDSRSGEMNKMKNKDKVQGTLKVSDLDLQKEI